MILFNSQGLICLPSVRKLRLGIAMADAYQRSGLVKVLQRLPNLADLGVWVLITHIILLLVFFWSVKVC